MMEWLTQPVTVGQALLWATAFIAIVGIILWREWQDVHHKIDSNETQHYQAERYASERISSIRDDIGRSSYAIGKLEMQVRELQTPLWKRWLRKIAA